MSRLSAGPVSPLLRRARWIARSVHNTIALRSIGRAGLCGLAALALGLFFAGCSALPSEDATEAKLDAGAALGRVDAARIVAADPKDWLSHGRTYDEQRYSPLAQIDEQNVSALGLAWSFDLASEHGVEATPLVADGVLYVTRALEHRLRARCGDGRAALDLRSRGAARLRAQDLLRRREPGRRALERSRLRRDPRRPARRDRPGKREPRSGRRRPSRNRSATRSPALRASSRAGS